MINVPRAVGIGVLLALAAGAVLLATTPRRPDGPATTDCSAMDRAERIARREIKDRASPDVGGMGLYHYEITMPHASGTPRTELVHPTVALWTPHGRLMGSDRGEFGGELVLADPDDESKPVTYLVRANIEDLFVMDFGIVATTGYYHLDQDVGSVLAVNFAADGRAQVDELFALPAAVRSSWVMRDGRLLVNTSRGSFAIASATDIAPVTCRQRGAR